MLSCVEESNHEFPKIISIENFNLPIYKIFIDSEYKKNERKEILGNESIIYPENIGYDEYNMILEFAHVAGNLNNSLTIVGIYRVQRHNMSKYNKTPYLYITESDCMYNTDDIQFNPILIKNNDIFKILWKLKVMNYKMKYIIF